MYQTGIMRIYLIMEDVYLNREDKLSFEKEEIAEYLKDVKKSMENNNYSLAINREKNKSFINSFSLNDNKIKDIILSLEVSDFSHKLLNDSTNPRYMNEILYVFGKQRSLLNPFSDKEDPYEIIEIYIKLNKVESEDNMFIISFHPSERALTYPFKNI